MSDVYLNNKYAGEAEDAKTFVEQFKTERRKGNITHIANISYNNKSDTIEIEACKGRARRPCIW